MRRVVDRRRVALGGGSGGFRLAFAGGVGETGRVTQAFLLGAGLGTRLQPLTSRLPKPLVPLFHRPLAEWALAACRGVGIRRIAINTHHLPECWEQVGEPMPAPGWVGANGVLAQARRWQDCELSLFHEPVLLETGGGIRNIADWIGDQPFLVHNGDVFSTMPLDRLLDAHQRSGLPVTLALRSTGEARFVAVDPTGSRCVDIRHRLERAPGTHVFTGIYCANRELIDRLPAGRPEPVLPTLIELAREDRLGAVVIDEGEWLDLGDFDAYLAAHHHLALGPAVHPDAAIEAGAQVHGSVVGPGAIVRRGACVRDSVLWPHTEVAAGAHLERCVVYANPIVTGHHRHQAL